jgi:4-amino-4-deoxy-L-arabinose transferase
MYNPVVTPRPEPTGAPLLRPASLRPRTVLIVLSLLVAFAFQGSRGLYESTEGRYTESAREMVRRGNYLEPTLAGRPHWTKPPVTYWAIAAGLRVGGVNGWGARLPNALAFVLTVLLVAGIGASLWDPATGVVAGLVYLTSIFPAAGATVVSTDTLLTFFAVLTVFLYVRAWRSEDRARTRWWIRAMWVAVGLGFLTKGPAEILPLMAIFAFDRLGSRRVPLLDPLGLAAFAVVGLSWFAAVNLRHPGLVRYFIDDEVVGRTLSNEFHRNPEWYKPFLIYLPILLLGQGAWLVPFARLFARERLASPRGLWARIRRADAASFLLLWLLIPAAVYWVSRSRLPLYVLPLFPPLALAVARALVRRDGAAAVTRALRVAIPSAAVLVLLKALSAYAAPVSSSDMLPLHRAIVREAGPAAEVRTLDKDPLYGLQFYLDGPLVRMARGDEAAPEAWVDEPLARGIEAIRGDRARTHAIVASGRNAGAVAAALDGAGLAYRKVRVASRELFVVPPAAP